MKKFEFRFERLLDIRKYQEREEQYKFAQVLGKFMATKNIIDTSFGKKKDYLLGSKNAVKNLNISYLVNRDKAIMGLSNRIKVHNNKLKEQKFLLEKEREVLLDKTKKRKTLEILKEKQFEKYKKEVEKAENYELDEIGTNIYLKNKK